MFVSDLRSNNTESCKPSSMPNSFVSPRSIWATSTWIITIGGRASSWSMIPFTSSKNRGVAPSTRLLLTTSGTTTTSRSICSKALVMPGTCSTWRSVLRNVLIVCDT